LIVSLSIGSVSIPLSEVFSSLFSGDDVSRKIVFDIRLPRTLNALIVGASLASSGLILQSLLRNNLAEPGLLGISSGAGLGAILIFMLPVALPFWLITPVSFLFAVLSTAIIFFIAKGINSKYTNFISTNKIILAGIAINALLASVNGFLLLVSGSGVIQIVNWLSGGFSGRGWNEFFISMPFSVAGIIAAVLLSKEMNLLYLGEEIAMSLGLNVKLIQRLSIALASLLAAAAVSVAGIISFVGLIIPNISRLIIGNDYKYNLICSLLLGGIFVVISDILARTIIAPSELPAGIFTSFIGAPVFIWLIFKKQNENG